MPVLVIVTRSQDTDAGRGILAETLAVKCAAAGFDTWFVPELYHLAEKSDIWRRLAAQAEPILLASGLHPRPAEWLLRRHGVTVPVTAWRLADFATADDGLAAMAAASGGASGGVLVNMVEETRPRWYPVVDYSRCVGCRHCLQFCLFGVYTATATGGVAVCHPDQCKPGCPACSRICPQGAISFPLYAKDAAIAGAPGLYPTPDPAARRMYYLRTKLPCPACGSTEIDPKVLQAGAGHPCCEECGRPWAPPAADGALEEIDALINELDTLTKGRS